MFDWNGCVFIIREVATSIVTDTTSQGAGHAMWFF
jgi:hypothetical protein